MRAGSGGGTHFLPPSLELTPLPLGYLVGGLSLVPDLHWVPVSSEGSCFPAKIHSLNTWETRFPCGSKAKGSSHLLSGVPKCIPSFFFWTSVSLTQLPPGSPLPRMSNGLYSQEVV